MSVHVFIANTPFQISYIKQIIAHLKIRNVRVFSSVVSSGIDEGISTNEIKGGVFSRIQYWRKSKKLLDSYDPNVTNFYIPHTKTVIANYVWYNKRNVSFYYEGALYLNNNYEDRITLYDILKWAFSFVIGINYKLRRRIVYLESNEVKSIIVPSLKLINNTKSRLVPFRRLNFFDPKGPIIFLGQPLQGLKKDSYIKQIQRCISILSDEHDLEILFKKHYSDPQRIADSLRGISVIKDDSPIEELLPIYRPSLVASFYSSALLNIRLYSEEIEIISFINSDDKFTLKDHQKIILRSFDKFNIKQLTI